MNTEEVFYDFLEQAPPGIRQQLEKVRSLIHRLLPGVAEASDYGIPFFKYRGPFMYFSRHKNREYVIGFCQGYRIEDALGKLSYDDGQKQIRH